MLCEEEDDEENCNTVRSLDAMFGDSILHRHYSQHRTRRANTAQHKHPNLEVGFYKWAPQYSGFGQQAGQQSQFSFF